jgi:hypothetical protein
MNARASALPSVCDASTVGTAFDDSLKNKTEITIIETIYFFLRAGRETPIIFFEKFFTRKAASTNKQQAIGKV